MGERQRQHCLALYIPFLDKMQFGPERARAMRSNPNSWALIPIKATDQNMRLMYQLFCALDTDGSGGLDERDFINASACGLFKEAATRSNKMLALVFEELKLFAADANGDGTVDFQEFSDAFMKYTLTQRFEMNNPPGAALRDYVDGLTDEVNKRLANMVATVASKLPSAPQMGAEPMSDEEPPVFGWLRVNPVCYQEVHDVFCQLDTNQSGGLDEQDLLQAAAGVQGVKNGWRNRVFVDVMKEMKRLSADANGDGVVDIGEFLRGIAKKALEERVQPSNSTLSFGEYFDGLEQQLNDRIRLLVTRISALLQGDPEQAGSPPGSPQLRGQDFHVR